jgi:hypothetical protein
MYGTAYLNRMFVIVGFIVELYKCQVRGQEEFDTLLVTRGMPN